MDINFDGDDFNVKLEDGLKDSDRAKNQKAPTANTGPQSYSSQNYQGGTNPSSISDNNNDSLSLNTGNYNLSQAGHPFACVATFIFKVAAIITY